MKSKRKQLIYVCGEGGGTADVESAGIYTDGIENINLKRYIKY